VGKVAAYWGGLSIESGDRIGLTLPEVA